MAQVVPYINFADRGREAIDFYKGVFGGEAEVQLVKDSPMAVHMNPEWGERIMHLDFKSCDIHFMGSDIISDQAGLERGNGYKLALACDSADQLHGYYDALSKSGNAGWPPADSEWDSIYAECTDQFGVTWMFNYDKPAA